MGGSGITIDIEVVRADNVLAPAEFRRRLWGYVCLDIRTRLRRVANRQVLDYYLYAEPNDGFASGQWSPEATDLSFVFHDGGGGNMSENASLHWIECSLANTVHDRDLNRLAEACGYRLKPRRTIQEIIAATSFYPLVELRRVLYCVATPREGSGESIEIFTDDGAGPLEYQTLTADERARVDAIARTKQCACEMCERIRGLHTRAAARQAARKAAAETGATNKGTAVTTRATTKGTGATTGAAAKKAAAKKAAAKKATAKKAAAKKPAARKPAAKKPTSKKAAAKNAAGKKPAARKPAARKPAAKATAKKGARARAP